MKIPQSSVPVLLLLVVSVVAAQTPAGSSQARSRILVFKLEILEFNLDLARDIERTAQDSSRLERLTAESKVRPLGEIQVRTRSGEPARVSLGQRVPFNLSQPDRAPQIQYENTGISLDITPDLQEGDRVFASIKLDLTTTARGSSANPTFSQRSFVNKVSLKPNERAMLLSVVQQGGLWPGASNSTASDVVYGNYLLVISVRILD